jgi:signal transduction histidine kinase
MMVKWILAGFCGVLIVLIGNAAVAYRNLRTLVKISRTVTHAHEVQRAIEGVYSEVIDMETGQRGFLLTGDEAYLAPYETARERISARLEQLNSLTKDNPAQQQRLEELKPLVAARQATLAHGVEVRRSQGLDAAMGEVSSGRGKREMDQIREIITAMQQAEDNLLKRRARQSRASARQVVLEFAIATALAVAAVVGLFGLYRRDVAERRRAQAELERRVTERTAELEAANKELEAFSYTVSHDLRAPLRAIDGFSRILIDDFSASLPAECQDYLRDVRENTQQMGRLVDDLLIFSRLSRQPLKRETIDTAELVRQVVEDLRAEMDGRQVALRIGGMPASHGDAALLKQVWANLLSNALKYTSKRSAATIEVDSLNAPDGEPIYFVRDNGVGFDMQYAHKLFGVFQRLHRAEEYSGTGVGLAIVQRIVQRHGGRVWAEARPDEGATFFFTLKSSETTDA